MLVNLIATIRRTDSLCPEGALEGCNIDVDYVNVRVHEMI